MNDSAELIDRRAEAPSRDATPLSELQCRDLFRDIREGFFVGEIVRDAAGRPTDFIFIEVNPAFAQQTGISTKDAVGRRVTEAVPGIQHDLI